MHMEGPGLEESPVQITGLEGLLLPPATASRPEAGPGAKLWVTSWRESRVKQCPCWPFGALEHLTDRKAGGPPTPKEKEVHRAGGANGPVPLGPWQEGVHGPEEMQTALSQSPCPWSLRQGPCYQK